MKSKAFMTKIKISAKYFGTDFNYYYYISDPIGPGNVRRSNKENQELILVHIPSTYPTYNAKISRMRVNIGQY